MNNTTVVESRSERSVTKALRCNLRAVLLLRAGQRFMLIAPILVPFFAHYGQDMQQIFLLESFYALIILLMEIPSGYLADRYGRVAVLRAGGLFWSLSWLSLIWVQGFSGLMAFNVLAGLGTSLLSGADLALLYDTERELQLDKPDRANRAVRNLFVIGMTAEGLASLSATGSLFYGDITLVIAAQTACGLLVLGAAMLLRETPRVNSGYKSLADEWGDLGRVLTSQWWHSVLMRRLLATLCLWPVVIVLAIWLMQRVWVELDLMLLHFGWIWCLLQLVGALAGHGAHAVERLLGSRRAIYAIGSLALVGLLLLGAAMLSWVMVGGVLLFAARGLFSVLFMDALNRRIDNDYRATINSLLGFGFRLGFIVAASLLGAVFDGFGLNASVFALGILALLVISVLLVPLARDADAA